MDFILVVAAILLVCLVLAAVLLAGRTSKALLPLVPKRLMTNREREAIGVLEGLFPDCRVHSQVAMAAILTTKKGLDKNARVNFRNRFDRKIIDYVIERRDSGDIVAIVELDDKTHDPARDAARDKMTKAAGYATIRIPAGTRLNRATLSEYFTTVADQPATPFASETDASHSVRRIRRV